MAPSPEDQELFATRSPQKDEAEIKPLQIQHEHDEAHAIVLGQKPQRNSQPAQVNPAPVNTQYTVTQAESAKFGGPVATADSPVH